jgi:hypothetical protein
MNRYEAGLFPISYIPCFIILRVVSSLNSVVGIYFNISGYEHCVFDLAIYAERFELVSKDLVEGILVNTEGLQRLTIFQVNESEEVAWRYESVLDNPVYFKETCSVNIVVALEECFERTLRSIFRNHLYSTKNTFILFEAK